MKICKVCKIENEDQFIYCKNCGSQLEVTPPAAPITPVPPIQGANPYAGVQYNPYTPPAPVAPPAASAGLVPVEMILPDPANPEFRRPQTVYVTPAQKAAIQYDAIKHGRKI